MTDPSGTYWGHRAAVIGAGAQTVTEVLEQGYESTLDMDGIILLALNALKQVIESELDSTKVEISAITEEDKKLKKVSAEEISKYIERM
jgi:proteasome alpha subunit